MTMWHEEFRGYQISYQSGDRFAWILPPGHDSPLAEKPEAGLGEGRVELRRQAKAVIDAEIAAAARSAAAEPAVSATG